MTDAALARSSFYWPIRLLPPGRRAGLSAVYAWCAHVDAIADGPGDRTARVARLAAWRDWLRAPSAPAPDPALGAAFAGAIADFGIASTDAQRLLAALSRDVTGDGAAPDTAALLDYCVGVAGMPGRMCLAVLGWRGAAAERYADAAGIAVQLTNILRDAAEDARAGRLYVPREALAAAGLAATQPAAALADPRFADAWTATAQLAAARFADAAALAHALAPGRRSMRRGLRPALAMVAIYRDLLGRLRRRGWRPDAPRLRTGRWRAAAIALRVLAWGR
jgi:phytoene synthase